MMTMLINATNFAVHFSQDSSDISLYFHNGFSGTIQGGLCSSGATDEVKDDLRDELTAGVRGYIVTLKWNHIPLLFLNITAKMFLSYANIKDLANLRGKQR